MTVSVLDTWFPNATNKRLVTKWVDLTLAAEAASVTAALLGLASVVQVSNAVSAAGIGYAGFASQNGANAYFYTDGAGAAWTGASPSLTTTLRFCVTGVPLDA